MINKDFFFSFIVTLASGRDKNPTNNALEPQCVVKRFKVESTLMKCYFFVTSSCWSVEVVANPRPTPRAK